MMFDDNFYDGEEKSTSDDSEVNDDEMQEILEDLHRGTFPEEMLNEIITDDSVVDKENELDKFDRLCKASKRRLYCKRCPEMVYDLNMFKRRQLSK